MPYGQLYYHIIWGTKYGEPIITAQIEPILFDFIRSKAIGLGGFVYALNGIEDHVHIVAHIPVTIPVANFIGQIKGSSSTRINKSTDGGGHFFWQTSYSVFTISKNLVPSVINYVKNQKIHHQEGSTIYQYELKE
jgi:REP element-mobilizing transposase RayT